VINVTSGAIGAPLVVTISLGYLGLLFAIAWWADRRAVRGRALSARPTVYALSLAVYCTAWTFYGSVGRAAHDGIGFLPIYLGPTLVVLLWGSLLVKMVRVSKAQRITSIADFIASRYGKSQALAGVVTVIAVIGVVPYISLQLKAIAQSVGILLSYPQPRVPDPTSMPLWHDTAFFIALLLAVFTILFGTRQLDASERHEGLVTAIAFESIVKLGAFMAVGAVMTAWLLGLIAGPAPTAVSEPVSVLLEPPLPPFQDWVAISVLAGLAVMLLPRQFQVAVVEADNEAQIRRAIWLFPLYLFLINLFVVPIAYAGLLTFAGSEVEADSFVLTLPIAFDRPWLALLVYIGGLSAASGMVIVEGIALATMISNDLVLPVLLRHWPARVQRADIGRLLLSVRRLAIVVILLLGYLYFRLAGEAYALVGIGLISFAAVAQFAPAVIGGLYWRGGTGHGAIAGLLAGFTLWIYTLLLPSFAKSGWLPMAFQDSGIFGIDALRPQALFGLEGWHEVTHCLFWSLTANVSAFALVSALRGPTAIEAAQASAFVDALSRHGPSITPLWRGSAEVTELMRLIGHFLGPARTAEAFAAHANARGLATAKELPADAETVELAENLLSGAIGGASARALVASVTQEESLGLEEVIEILDEASQIRAYSRQLEQKSRALEAATAELKAANVRLRELDRLKDDFMSSVTHELRTPLSAIRAFSEILYDDPEIELAERKRFLGILVSETERLSRLVNQVLDLAKLESGHADWALGPLDLETVVTQAIDATEQLLRGRGIRVTRDAPPTPVEVVGDSDRLVQVVVNLLSNAAKVVPSPGGSIHIELARADSWARVCVDDNGPGIPANEREAVFKKFHQSASGGEKPVGTGLGLPICQRIIEHLGGRIWAGAPASGPGGRVCFELPALAADDQAAAVPDTTPGSSRP
jgi:Na+/proline symporter/nitrogen-specific signal transduction histidine kinase